MIIWLRVIILVLLGFALWNPKIQLGADSVDFILVVDESASMADKLSLQHWADIRHAIADLPAGSRLAIIRFAANAVLEVPLSSIDTPAVTTILNTKRLPRMQSVDQSASNLEQALNLAQSLLQNERASETSLLIVHDGQQTVGNAANVLQQLYAQVAHIFQLHLLSVETSDSWIAAVELPLFAEHHQQVPLTVTLGSYQTTSGMLNVWMNEDLVLQETVQLSRSKLLSRQFNMLTCDGEFCKIKVQLQTVADSVEQNNTRLAVITLNTIKPVLYVHKHQQPALLTSLQSVNFNVDNITPDLCIASVAQLIRYRAVILDDISIQHLSTACWTALDNAVRKQGVGLIVLGGEDSFSGGAYRHSLLESLLPVTAEAAELEQQATVLFLIDKSGSMDNDSSGNSRIALARQAIIDTLRAQNGKDSVGLISFDTQAQILVPIQVYDDVSQVIRDRFILKASGGTKLKPALDLAIEKLAQNQGSERILVLVTDGFLDTLDLQQAAGVIAENNITLIILAIGKHEKTQDLQQLLAGNGGYFLQVNDIAELPMLMRQTVDKMRAPIEAGQVLVKQVRKLPFQNKPELWPDLSAYRVTKAKLGSYIYLQSAKGDPLWAMNFAGSGKVIAIPGGLNLWASQWLSWDQWPVIIEGLINSVSTSRQHPFMDISLLTEAGFNRRVQLDITNPEFNWLTSLNAELSLIDPYQQLHKRSLPLIAPGQYISDLELIRQGLYKVAVKAGEYNASFQVFNNAIEEYIPAATGRSHGINATARPVTPTNLGSTLKSVNSHRTSGVRSRVLIIILLLYVLLINLENKPSTKIIFPRQK